MKKKSFKKKYKITIHCLLYNHILIKINIKTLIFLIKNFKTLIKLYSSLFSNIDRFF